MPTRASTSSPTWKRGVKSVTLGSILKLSHALGCAPGGLLADFTQSQIRKLVR